MTIQTPTTTARIGLVQMRTGTDIAANVSAALAGIRAAKAAGCGYVQTPENTTLMAVDRDAALAAVKTESDTAALVAFASAARELGIWLHIGSLPVVADSDQDRLANRSVLIDPSGQIAARYDKIHMFDVDLDGPSGGPETYRESATFRPGDRAVIADLPFGRLGLTVCYDVRFPALHRALAHGGATMLAVPAAFTAITGAAHWHILLRARAIETGCFVFAAAQGGLHANGRRTFGHSMIIDPWGTILAEAAGDEPEVIVCDIDLGSVQAVRRKIPSLQHDRAFATQLDVSR
jgi:deaminated glutathione amidase